jgi:peptidoglycan/LPS O-acetylase OafA/YrhL
VAAIDGSGPARAGTYRPHLDGIRAVAVYLVVAFHAGADRLEGGFIGVDVFFVLSGYLVTRLLLDGAGVSGRPGLVRFYARRIRRLLPAAAVNLAVTAVVFRAIAAPAEFADARGSMQAAALYVSNWWFIRESADYFGSTIEASPVLHYWSLSVEEQYYILWPLLLTGLLGLVRGRPGGRRLAGVIVVGMGGLSLAAALWIGRDDLIRAYYGTDTRAYQLLAGASLAFLPGVVVRLRRSAAAAWLPVAGAAALLGLVGASTSALDVSPITRGAVATALAVTLIVSLEAADGGPVRWLLSRPPLAFLGRISYGTYLWHWIVVLVAVRRFDLTPGWTFLVTAGVASGLAALSYELVEQPIRRNGALDRAAPAVVAVGVALSLFVALVAVPRTLDPARTTQVAAGDPLEGTPVAVDWEAAQRDVPDFAGCDQSRTYLCPIHEGSGPRVLLVGDSHAAMLVPAFEEVARRQDLEMAGAFMLNCPWTRGIAYFFGDPEVCYSAQAAAFDEVLPAFDPDVVVLVHRSIDDPADPQVIIDREQGGMQATPQRLPLVEQRDRDVIDALRADGRRVVVVEPIPQGDPTDPQVVCLSTARFVEECRHVASTEPLAEELVFRDADRVDDELWTLDLDRRVCPFLPICDPVLEGRVVRYDAWHLTADFAATLADPIERFLLDNDVLER